MRTRWLPLALALGGCAPAADEAWFSGSIAYHMVAHDAKGKHVPLADSIQTVYLGAGSFKVLDEQGRLQILYDDRTNQRRGFTRAGKLLVQGDTLRPTYRPLPDTGRVLGYACRAVQVRGAGNQWVSTVLFAPALQVNPVAFRSRATGSTGALLQATSGALPLRITMVSTNKLVQQITLVMEATAVTRRPLTPADFVPDTLARPVRATPGDSSRL